MKIQIGDQIRDMTDDEAANYSAVINEAQTAMAATNAIKTSLKNKLAALGLTENELAALIGA